MPSISFPTSEEEKNNNIKKTSPQIKNEEPIPEFTNKDEINNGKINENQSDIGENPFINQDGNNINNHKISYLAEDILISNEKEKNDEDNDKYKIDIKKNDKEDLNSKDNMDARGQININNPEIKTPLLDSDINNNLNISGEINLVNKIEIKESNIKLNEQNLGTNINISGMNINNPQNDIKEELPGININNPQNDIKVELPGTNINNPQNNVYAKMPSINIDNPKGETKVSDIKITVPDIHSPLNQEGDLIDLNQKITVKQPDLNVKVPEININGSYKKHGEFFLSGIILGTKDTKKKNDSKTNVDVNLKGDIKGPKIDINEPNTNVNIKVQNEELTKKNVNIKKGQIPSGHFLLEGIIKGDKKYKKKYTPNIIINGNTPDIKINSPKAKMNLDQNVQLTGNIERSKKIDVKAPNAEFDLNIKNSNNLLSDINPGIKSSDKNINPSIKFPNINNEIKIDLDKNISGIQIENPKIELPSKGIKFNGNLEGQEIKSPNLKTNFPNIDLKGSIIDVKSPDININGPKLDGKMNLNGPNLNFEGINGSKKNFCLSGTIKGTNKMSTNEQGINIEGPNLDVKGNTPKINIKDPNIDQNLQGNINLKGDNNLTGLIIGIKDKKLKAPNINMKGPELNNNLNGKLEVPVPNAELNLQGSNVNAPNIILNNQKINGQIGGNIDLKSQEPLMSGIIQGVKLNSQKIVINGPSVDVKDSHNNFKLEGIIPSKNEGKKIQKECINPIIDISGKAPNMDFNGDFSKKNKLYFHESINDQNYVFEKDLKGSRKLDFDGMKNLNLEMPKFTYNTKSQVNFGELNPIEIGGGNIGGGINFSKNNPIPLNVKTDNNINEDNKFGINVNLDGDIKKSDINLENLAQNFISENSETKILVNSALGRMKKKGKGLPMVGNKINNFEQSKVDTAGNFDEDNINIDNLKIANVGVNGQKIGERIVE